jgi:hypothetical protein
MCFPYSVKSLSPFVQPVLPICILALLLIVDIGTRQILALYRRSRHRSGNRSDLPALSVFSDDEVHRPTPLSAHFPMESDMAAGLFLWSSRYFRRKAGSSREIAIGAQV